MLRLALLPIAACQDVHARAASANGEGRRNDGDLHTFVTVRSMPRYHEMMLLTKLAPEARHSIAEIRPHRV